MRFLNTIKSGECLLKYRKELMGLAMIWIMIFHSYPKLIVNYNIPIIYTICKHGNLGVEIFLFLSGFGLYYSLSKNDQMLPFYKRRINRVVLPWLIISCPYWVVKTLLVDKESVGEFFLNLSGLSFWIKGITTIWYIAFIVLLYGLYPLIFRIQKKNNDSLLLLIGVSILLNIALLMLCPEQYEKIEIALTRIPVFLLGSYVGASVYKSKKIVTNKKVLIYLFALVFLYVYPVIYNYIGMPVLSSSALLLMKRLRGQIVAFLVIILSCLVFSAFKLIKIKNLLSFIGTLTLEEYMLHVFLGNIFHRSGIYGKLNTPMKFLLMTFIIVVTVIVSYLFSKVYSNLINRFDHKEDKSV